jgi:hypothetical protein
MSIDATCTRCGRSFGFREQYTAAPDKADRCPRCDRSLGIINIGPLAARADVALDALARYLKMLADNSTAFRISAESVTEPLTEALSGHTGVTPHAARLSIPA